MPYVPYVPHEAHDVPHEAHLLKKANRHRYQLCSTCNQIFRSDNLKRHEKLH